MMSNNPPIDARPYIRAYLWIRGGPNADTITKLLKLKPDEYWNKGDIINSTLNRRPPTARKRTFTAWELHSNLKRHTYSIEDHIQNILSRIKRSKYRILRLNRRRYFVGINIAVDMTTEGSSPAYSLTERTIKMLAEVNLYLDVDIYVHEELPEYAQVALRNLPNDS